MSNNKWAAVGVAASVVGVAALGGAAAMAYFMLKEDEDFRSRWVSMISYIFQKIRQIKALIWLFC